MLARMLLALVVLPLAVHAEPNPPVQWTHVYETVEPVRWVHFPPSDSVYTIGLPDGHTVEVLAENFTVEPARGTPHPRVRLIGTARSTLASEIDRVKRWEKLTDFLFGKYRPTTARTHARVEWKAILIVQDQEEFENLQSTLNPYWDKD